MDCSQAFPALKYTPRGTNATVHGIPPGVIVLWKRSTRWQCADLVIVTIASVTVLVARIPAAVFAVVAGSGRTPHAAYPPAHGQRRAGTTRPGGGHRGRFGCRHRRSRRRRGLLAVSAWVGVLGMRMRDAVGTSLLVVTVSSPAALAARAGTVKGMGWAGVGPFVGAAGREDLRADTSADLRRPAAGGGGLHADRRDAVKAAAAGTLTPATGTAFPAGRASRPCPRRSCGRTRCPPRTVAGRWR